MTDFNMVANRPVHDKKEEGMPLSGSQEIGSNDAQREAEKASWLEALDEEKALLAEMMLMEQEMSRIEIRMAMAQERRGFRRWRRAPQCR